MREKKAMDEIPLIQSRYVRGRKASLQRKRSELSSPKPIWRGGVVWGPAGWLAAFPDTFFLLYTQTETVWVRGSRPGSGTIRSRRG